MPPTRSLLSVLGLFCCVACGATASTSTPRSEREPLQLTLVLLKTGPRTEPLADTERRQVFGGHMGNMQRLARERQLLVAGPYGKQRSDPVLRGLFVLDTVDREHARRLAETDPGFQAGVFALEYHELTTTAPLRAVLAADLADVEAAQKENRTLAPGEGGRSYVLLTVEDGAAAERLLTGHAAVLLTARLDGTRALVLLDAQDRPAAQAILAPLLRELGAIRLDEWFATGHLDRLLRPLRG